MVNESKDSSSEPCLNKELVEIIENAMPQIERTPRWIAGINELPPNLQLNEIFLWRSAEKAEPPRLLNSALQSLLIEITILFVIVKNPRGNGKSFLMLETLKQQLRKAIQGWIPKEEKARRFLPAVLEGGAPLVTRDGKELWTEKIRCKAIQTQ